MTRLLLVCALAALLAAGLLVWATPDGLLMDNDGFTYVEGARQMLAGHGYSASIPPEPLQPVTHFPPLYSLAIAAATLVTKDALLGALAVNVFCFGALAGLAAWLVGSVSGNPWLAALAALGIITSQHLLECASRVLSEPLFLVLGLGVTLALVTYAEKPTRGRLVAAALLAGVTTLARYSGLVWVAMVPLVILLFTPAPWRRRIGSAVLAGVLALLPFIALSLRNLAVAGSATHREMHTHVVGLAHFREGALVGAAWLLPWRFCTVATGGVLALLAAVLLGWLAGRARLVLVSAVFAGVYVVHLLLAISFLHYNTPLDLRLLSPLLVVLLVTLAVWPALVRNRFATVVVTLLLALQVTRATTWVRTNRNPEHGFRGAFHGKHPAIELLKTLPPETEIYSDHSMMLYVLCGRPVRAVPPKRDLYSTALNPEGESVLRRIAADSTMRPIVLAHFPPHTTTAGYESAGVDLERYHDFSLAELQHFLRLEALVTTKEVTVYRVAGAPALPSSK
jgi:hypothetical protein